MRAIVVGLTAYNRTDPALSFVSVAVRFEDWPDYPAMVPVPKPLGDRLRLGDKLDVNVDPQQED